MQFRVLLFLVCGLLSNTLYAVPTPDESIQKCRDSLCRLFVKHLNKVILRVPALVKNQHIVEMAGDVNAASSALAGYYLPSIEEEYAVQNGALTFTTEFIDLFAQMVFRFGADDTFYEKNAVGCVSDSSVVKQHCTDEAVRLLPAYYLFERAFDNMTESYVVGGRAIEGRFWPTITMKSKLWHYQR